MFEVIRCSSVTNPLPSYLSVTTITNTFKVDTEIDIQTIKERMKEKPFVIRKKGSKDGGCIWNIKDNKFFNQITVEFKDDFSKKSIKFFPNGSIHVTGCSDLTDCHRVMAKVRFCIETYTKKPIKTFDFKILMINANFSMNHTLNLSTVSRLAENGGCSVSFKPEIYSAVKIKFVPGANMKKITTSVFSSGCVLITGAKTLAEITASYRYMINMLQSCCVSESKTIKNFDSFSGISFDVWKKHLLGTN